MFKPSVTSPKSGEIRLGYVKDSGNTHRYVGVHPYLIVSNDIYNKFSGQSECIPFTTKRMRSNSPAHVNFATGEVTGLSKDSTLIIESRDIIRNDSLSEPIGYFTEANWDKVIPAMMVQNPCIQAFLNRMNDCVELAT